MQSPQGTKREKKKGVRLPTEETVEKLGLGDLEVPPVRACSRKGEEKSRLKETERGYPKKSWNWEKGSKEKGIIGSL